MTDVPFGFAMPGGIPDPNDPQQLAKFFAQIQQMFTSTESGPVNWELARQAAEGQVAADDPPVTPADRTAVDEALRLADLWLESESTFPSGIQSTVAWTRRQWIGATLDVWRTLCDPVAARMVSAMSEIMPEEARSQLGPMTAMVQSLGGAMFGAQLGAALASLAGEVLASTEIGLPLAGSGTAGLIPANITAYGTGLELPADEVRLYVALREAAHQRLFAHVPWLQGHVRTAVEAYAKGMRVNREAIEEALGRVDPMRPETMQELNFEGVFAPEDSPAQRAALSRLETALALIEGWVTQVVDRAVADRLPNLNRLGEAFRRRRAEGGPAEQTFAALVGLELRPRRLREASAVWDALLASRGMEGRDAIWAHPDLLPTGDDFADPTAFAEVGSFDISDMGFGDAPAIEEPSAKQLSDARESADKKPGDPTPGDPTPGDPAPDDRAPGDTPPNDTAPGDSPPDDKTPNDKTPDDTAPDEGDDKPGTDGPRRDEPPR